MGNSKTTIELNGKVYDAASGAVVHDKNKDKPLAAQNPLLIAPITTVDGVFRPNEDSQPAPAPKHSATRRASKTSTGHKPEKSTTLMRHALKKPTVKAVHQTSAAKTSNSKEASKPQVASLDKLTESRLKRAGATPKSSKVSRFNANPSKTYSTVEHLPVQPHPEEKASQAAPAEAPAISVHHSTKAVAEHAKSSPSASSTFSKALSNANSHSSQRLKSPKLRHKTAKKLGVSTRTLGVVVSLLLVVVIGSFLVYQNQANISMRIAAARAGFNASLPSYTPAGFRLSGPIVTKPGEVTVSFQSNSDQRNFELSQQPSNWTSNSLLSNFVLNHQQQYQTLEVKGKTIYFTNNMATWVSGGVWYTLKNNGNLNTDQLSNIANSF